MASREEKLNGRKALAKHWRVGMKRVEAVITKRKRTLDDPSVPDHIKEGWKRRLPMGKDGYRVPVSLADAYKREHMDRLDLQRGADGKVTKTLKTKADLEAALAGALYVKYESRIQ